MYRVFGRSGYILAGAAAALLLAVCVGGGLGWLGGARQTQAALDSPLPTIILDAGHGGVDPGAIGVNGVQEKDVNLAIARDLRDILTVNGYPVRMIRDGDASVHDPQYHEIARIKTSDLKNRLKTIDSQPAIVLTIHQNFFGEADSHGAQMFYGRQNPASEKLAEALQAAFRANLQPDNSRRVKRSTRDVYILHNAQNPIVLVECGFLSNPAECEALCDPDYQQKVAFTIFSGLSDYLAAPPEADGSAALE